MGLVHFKLNRQHLWHNIVAQSIWVSEALTVEVNRDNS